MIISLVSGKGGAGKSTIAVNLAALAAAEMLRVAIVDLDPQATASGWHAMRGSMDISLTPSHPPILARTTAALVASGIQIVIIDTPPHHSAAAIAAIRVSDLVLVPARPSAFDLAAVAETADLVRQGSGRAASVLNAVPARSSVAQQARAVMESFGLPVLACLGQRIGWQHAAACGKGVYETEPESSSAGELVALWNRANEFMNARTHEYMSA
jgi:chromosome partitioning protein